MRQDGDEITMSRDELVQLIRTIQGIERWITKGAGGDLVFLPNAKATPLTKAKSAVDYIKAFEERFKTKFPALEKLAFDLLAQIEELQKSERKITGDGSAWIVSTKLEQKPKSGDLRP